MCYTTHLHLLHLLLAEEDVAIGNLIVLDHLQVVCRVVEGLGGIYTKFYTLHR